MNPNLELIILLDKNTKENGQQSLLEFQEEFLEKIGTHSFNYMNPELVLISLYSSIVLPWEKLKYKLPKKIMLTQLETDKWGSYKILNHNPSFPLSKIDLRFFIRKLRNSISHNKVTIDKELNIIFRDKDGMKIKYAWNELLKLIRQLNLL